MLEISLIRTRRMQTAYINGHKWVDIKAKWETLKFYRHRFKMRPQCYWLYSQTFYEAMNRKLYVIPKHGVFCLIISFNIYYGYVYIYQNVKLAQTPSCFFFTLISFKEMLQFIPHVIHILYVQYIIRDMTKIVIFVWFSRWRDKWYPSGIVRWHWSMWLVQFQWNITVTS